MNYIQMNTEMTKAILDGRKVMTRRAITNENIVAKLKEWKTTKSLEAINFEKYISFLLESECKTIKTYGASIKTKYQIGETIWVREPAKIFGTITEEEIINYKYIADGYCHSMYIPNRFLQDEEYPKWIQNKQGIPNGCIKEMARIFLKVTNVRVERLQDMHWQDFSKEGAKGKRDGVHPENGIACYEYKTGFIELWNKTAPKGYPWEDNPYVFVYEFERVDK